MATRVVMPRLSLTMKEGTVVQWFKKEGDIVQKGEPIVEVLSEKVTYDVEAPASGVLRKILVPEGANVPVDEAVGIIRAPEEQLPEMPAAVESPIEKVEEAASVSEREETIERAEERFIASPAAKRLAREHGVDLAKVRGTGPEGHIVEDDVKRVIEETETMPKVRETVSLSGIRRTTAERVSLSARTAPHSTITMEVDATNATQLREKLQVSFTDILVKAASEALREHPIMNSSLEGDLIKIFEDVNVGVAVATEKGLVVPVIHGADKKPLAEISSITKELVEKARQGRLSRNELSGGTFTVTNLGMFGVDVFIPIINPPEAAILGAGRVVEKPVLVDKEMKTKPVMQLSLSFDHRIVDGAPAARFLRRVKQLLENPPEAV